MERVLEAEQLENSLLNKCEYLVSIGLWPSGRKIDYKSWLRNFTEQEKPYALHLLDNFTYFNDELCNELFKEAFVKAGQSALDYSSSQSLQSQWHNFFKSCVISPVRGEMPSLADSGYSFIQKARNLFGIEEEQFKEPVEALKERFRSYMNNEKCKPIVFVDDFIGSGSQFYNMWTKMYDIFNIDEHSHETLSQVDKSSRVYYCSLLSTENGLSKLKMVCTDVNFCISHIIPTTDSIFNNPSRVWDNDKQYEGIKMLRDASLRYGMPNTSGRDVNDWKGYGEQGLLLGIRDGAPDASIGAIRWDKNGWQPLIEKG